jgi:hypothetical protein
MMKKLLLFTMLLASISISSCSKDSAKPTLVGKWKYVSTVLKFGATTESIIGLPGDYLDFKSNGILEFNVAGDTDTMPYTINGNKVTLDNTKEYTLTLTATTATLYFTELINGVRDEATINLKK